MKTLTFVKTMTSWKRFSWYSAYKKIESLQPAEVKTTVFVTEKFLYIKTPQNVINASCVAYAGAPKNVALRLARTVYERTCPTLVHTYIHTYIHINNHRSSGFRSNHWSFIATVLFRMVRNCRTTLIRQLQRLTVHAYIHTYNTCLYFISNLQSSSKATEYLREKKRKIQIIK